MIGKYQRRSLRITGIHEFNSDQFLRRLHKSSISLDLMIMTDARTEIALSVWDRSIFRENNAENKLTILKKLLDGCSFEDSIIPIIDNNKALIHVVGLPVVREKQIEEIIKKEDKTKPLSDEQIKKILERKNIKCARRTIAKYRKKLSIGTSSMRKSII